MLEVGGVELQGYIDFDWVRSVVDRKSTSGCCFNLGSATISWYNRKQQPVALSSVKAEYMAISMVSCEEKWLRKMLARLFDLKHSIKIGRSELETSQTNRFTG